MTQAERRGGLSEWLLRMPGWTTVKPSDGGRVGDNPKALPPVVEAISQRCLRRNKLMCRDARTIGHGHVATH